MAQTVPSSDTAGPFKFAFETPRLYLQELSVEDHLELYHVLWSNPANLVTLPYAPMKTLSDSRERMTPHTNSPSRPFVENYAIFLKPASVSRASTATNSQHVGFVGAIREIHNAGHLGLDGAPEFGYMVSVEHQGKGLGTEAVKGFLELYWGLDRRRDVGVLVAVVDEGNSGSVKVLEKVGGKRVGKEKDGEVWIVKRPGRT